MHGKIQTVYSAIFFSDNTFSVGRIRPTERGAPLFLLDEKLPNKNKPAAKMQKKMQKISCFPILCFFQPFTSSAARSRAAS